MTYNYQNKIICFRNISENQDYCNNFNHNNFINEYTLNIISSNLYI